MLDVYFGNMDGVEVHAETPEEEQEAAFILNSALSGKTTSAGGCLCPSEEKFWEFMDTNFPGVKLPLEAEHRKPSRWDLLWSK